MNVEYEFGIEENRTLNLHETFQRCRRDSQFLSDLLDWGCLAREVTYSAFRACVDSARPTASQYCSRAASRCETCALLCKLMFTTASAGGICACPRKISEMLFLFADRRFERDRSCDFSTSPLSNGILHLEHLLRRRLGPIPGQMRKCGSRLMSRHVHGNADVRGWSAIGA